MAAPTVTYRNPAFIISTGILFLLLDQASVRLAFMQIRINNFNYKASTWRCGFRFHYRHD
jgi:hypothetical protein